MKQYCESFPKNFLWGGATAEASGKEEKDFPLRI